MPAGSFSLPAGLPPTLDQWAAAMESQKILLGWVAFLSVVLFLGCLVIVPWLVARIPADYFDARRRPRTRFASLHPALRWSGLIAKNLMGGMLILAGLAMLVLPGQGLLTLAVGILLVDFPKKHQLERRMIRFPPILRSVNWLRKRAGVEPIGHISQPNE